MMGGNAVYAAVGARVWGASVGLISRVGCDYPSAWLESLHASGFDVTGVQILSEPQDTRTFYAYLTPEERVDTNPAAHFLRIGQPLPKQLLGYQSSTEGQEARSAAGPLAVRPDDVPAWAAGARGAHLAPADYLTHALIPGRLRESGLPLVTLDPSVRYMDPGFRLELPPMLNGLDAFLPSEAEARAFYRSEREDLWEMAEGFAAMGCRCVVIKCGARGQMVWDAAGRKRWQVPAYPATVRDVTGAGDAFCGGFLTGLDRTGDPLEAALWGSISASLVLEGSGALYALDGLPGLAEARLASLRQGAKQM
jgi:ribokinase